MSIERAILVAKLIGHLQGVDGRKRLQKIVHLLQVRGFKEFSYSFDLHYYGPFSRELADELDFLCEAGVVEENKAGDTYQYRLHDADQDFRVNIKNNRTQSNSWSSLALTLTRKNIGLLEAASTIAFLSKEVSLKGSRLQSEFFRLKPNLRSLFGPATQFLRAQSILSLR